jgi:short chain dehydrogenase
MLQGKAAVVTGSTSGIGLGIARALAAQGANIMLNGFGERSAIEALMVELRAQYGVEVDYSSADMSRPEQVTEMVAQCAARFGAVDILVNNAGIQHTAPVEEFPMEKWEQILAINLSSAFCSDQVARLRVQVKRRQRRIAGVATVPVVLAFDLHRLVDLRQGGRGQQHVGRELIVLEHAPQAGANIRRADDYARGPGIVTQAIEIDPLNQAAKRVVVERIGLVRRPDSREHFMPHEKGVAL